MVAKRNIIIDTDIGSDIDDTWALVYLLSNPNINILAIAVTSGDTNYKAKYVSSLLHKLGKDNITLIAGKPENMANKPQERWLSANTFYKKYSVSYDESMKEVIETNKDATIMLLGPCNDFGNLLKNNKGLIKNRDVIFMGGGIYKGYYGSKEVGPECNIICGIEGAREVFSSGANVTLLPLDVNNNIVIKGKEYKKLKSSPYKYARAIMENYEIWQQDYEGGAVKFDINKTSSRLFDLSVPFYFEYPENYEIKELPIFVKDNGVTEIDEQNGFNIKVATSVRNSKKMIKEFVKSVCLTEKKSSFADILKDNWRMLLIALPAIIIVAIFSYAPMFGLIIAFKNYKPALGIFGSKWVQFKKFQQFFGSPSFGMVLKNTLIVSIYSLAVNTIVPIFLAILVNEVSNEKVKRFFQMFSYAPYFISLVVLVGMFNCFLGSEGFVNNIITKLGGDSVDFLTSESTYYSVYVFTGLWAGCGWWSIIYVNALGAIPKDIQEASAIDGASRFKRIIYINLPYIKPTILTLFILAVGGIMSVGFEKTILMQNALNYNASEFISSYTYTVSFVKNKDFSYGTAVGLFNSVVNCILLISANVLSKKLTDKSLI